jgi:hypothetical protein
MTKVTVVTNTGRIFHYTHRRTFIFGYVIKSIKLVKKSLK